MGASQGNASTHPPRKAPSGFRAGRGEASAIRLAEVWKLRAATERAAAPKRILVVAGIVTEW